tara:strand:+ start:770 stop:928 length:159 start_codon:yes stop_codon:yes gene_type:complete
MINCPGGLKDSVKNLIRIINAVLTNCNYWAARLTKVIKSKYKKSRIPGKNTK